jgi:hypothetical protein
MPDFISCDLINLFLYISDAILLITKDLKATYIINLSMYVYSYAVIVLLWLFFCHFLAMLFDLI